jgi:hypothetical protein
MRKAIERLLMITASVSLLAMLPLASAQAGNAPAVNVDIASHFTPEVSAPSSTLSLAPMDPRRHVVGGCGGIGGSCLELSPPSRFILPGGVTPTCTGFCDTGIIGGDVILD